MVKRLINTVELSAVRTNFLPLSRFFAKVSAFDSLCTGIIIKEIILKGLYESKVLLEAPVSLLDRM